MGLPSPHTLKQLALIIKDQRPVTGPALEAQLRELAHPEEVGQEDQLRGLARSPSFIIPDKRGIADKGANYLKKAAQTAVPMAATYGVNSIVETGIKVGTNVKAVGHVINATTHLAPLGAALSAWIGMATVAVQASKVLDLYTLRDDARGGAGGETTYSCKCGKCAKNIQYIIDKKERNVAIVAVSVGTVGVAKVLKGVHSAGKRFKSWVMSETRPKEQACKELVESARGGCLAAMGTIFLLSGSWTQGYREKATMKEAVVTIMSENGWSKLRDNF